MTYYIVSDQHFGALGNDDAGRLQIWNAFCSFLCSQKKCTLVIAGDFFDFWISYKQLVRTEYLEILSSFKQLHDAGVPVIYIRGNHDFMDMSLLATGYGIRIVNSLFECTLGSHTIRIQHGDRLKFSIKHSIVNRILWSPVSQWFYRLLPVDFAISLALRVAHVSRKSNINNSQNKKCSKKYQALAKERDHKDGVAVSVIGHVHYADLVQEDGWIFANAGTWLKAPTLLELTPSEIALKELDCFGMPSITKLSEKLL